MLRSLTDKEIGERVRRLRELAHWSGRTLSVAINRSTNFKLVHRIETGVQKPQRWLEPIARTLVETGWEDAFDYLTGRIDLSALTLREEEGLITFRDQHFRENNNSHRLTELTRLLCLPEFKGSYLPDFHLLTLGN